MSKSGVPLLLRIEDTGNGGFKDVEFNQPVVKIGKLSSVHLRLDDPSVNRIHAIIEVTASGEAKIIDMGSSKGTKVNGKRVYKSQLNSGDEILIGSTKLFVYIGAEEIARAKGGGTNSDNGTGREAVQEEEHANAEYYQQFSPPESSPPPIESQGGPFASFEQQREEEVDERDEMEDEGSTQVVKNPLQPSEFESGGAAENPGGFDNLSSQQAPQPPSQFHPPAPEPQPQIAPSQAEPQSAPYSQSELSPKPHHSGGAPTNLPQHYQQSQSPEYPNQQAAPVPADNYSSPEGREYYSHPQENTPQNFTGNNQGMGDYGQPQVQGNFSYQSEMGGEQYSQQSYGQTGGDLYPQQVQQSQIGGGAYNPQMPQGNLGQINTEMAYQGAPQYQMTGPFQQSQSPATNNFQTGGQQFQPQPYSPGQSQSPAIGGQFNSGMGSSVGVRGYPPAPAPVAPPPSPSMAMIDASIAETQEVLEVKVWWKDTILDHSHFYEPKKITVGESKKNTFSLSVSAIPETIDSYPLIEVEDERVFINFTPQMNGEIVTKDNNVIYLNQIVNTERVRRTEYGFQFPLPADAKVFLRMDEIVFEISFVPAPKKLPPFLTHQFDQSLARAIGASFLIHGLLLLMMLFADETPQDLDEEFFLQNNRFAQLIIRPEEPEEKKKKKRESGGARAKGKKGKMGKPSAKAGANRRAGQKERNPDGTAPINIDKNLEKEIVDKIAKKGMLGLLAGGGGSRAGGIITAKGLGGDDADGLGWHTGVKVGDALGSGGLGEGGLGSGGGGFSGAAAGLGSVGTYGIGGGKGGRGWGRSRLRKKRKRKLTISTGPPTVYGGLDKEIIRRIIRQHRSRFQHCYERELMKNPNLQGKVYVKFQIEPNGRVLQSSVSRTTINNDRLEECLVRRIRLLRFPPPKGGGIVIVNYPFIFKPS